MVVAWSVKSARRRLKSCETKFSKFTRKFDVARVGVSRTRTRMCSRARIFTPIGVEKRKLDCRYRLRRWKRGRELDIIGSRCGIALPMTERVVVGPLAQLRQ